MTLKFLVDAQLPPALAAWIREAGYEAVALRDVGLRHAKDWQICDYAAANGYIVVTKDRDFAALARNQANPRILWIRIGNAVNEVLLTAFASGWPDLVEHLESDAPIVVLK